MKHLFVQTLDFTNFKRASQRNLRSECLEAGRDVPIAFSLEPLRLVFMCHCSENVVKSDAFLCFDNMNDFNEIAQQSDIIYKWKKSFC